MLKPVRSSKVNPARDVNEREGPGGTSSVNLTFGTG